MMRHFKILISLCLTTVTISGEIHHPKVYEDKLEYNKNENIRTARNSESTYRSVHQPPVFKFEAAKQQDYLKFRYAEQQKANSNRMVNGIEKNYRYHSQSKNMFPEPNPMRLRNHGLTENTNDWQPFEPKNSKHNEKHTPGLLHIKSTKNIKLYKPSLQVSIVPKPSQTSFLERSTVQATEENNMINSTNTIINDLVAAGSEIVENNVDINRRDAENQFENIIFLHPNQLQEHLRQNSEEKQNLGNSNVNIEKPEMQLTALSDLVGKNPNIQLEGLKRLLQGTSPNLPVVRGPEPFHARDHTPISEKMVDIPNTQTRPNIQVNHVDNTITLQGPQIIDKGSFEDLQKQLDEASKVQAQKVLARAQQEAFAQVEAQHKAIALAQVQAQNEALENIKNSLYGNPQALPLVQNTQEEKYDTVVNTAVPIQPQAPPPPTDVLSIPTNHNIPITPHSHIIQTPGKLVQHSSANSLQNDIFVNQIVSQPGTRARLIHRPLDHNVPVALYKNVAPQSYGSKELLYYAPNHHHQTAAQLQAENAILAQVEEQNKAVIHRHKNIPSAIQQILKTEKVKNDEVEDASSVHTSTEPKPESTAYQHFSLESQDVEDTAAEQKDYDDIDDLQYAAKYAFGYRIKDAKEGNDFGHEERRNGKSLEGSYHVLLPDGRLQKVEYYADKSGYHAKVTYEHLSH